MPTIERRTERACAELAPGALALGGQVVLELRERRVGIAVRIDLRQHRARVSLPSAA